MVQMNTVQSSAIRSVGYDQGETTLYVTFKSGEIYKYFGVSHLVYKELMAANSIGTYFDCEVRKKAYRFEHVR
jgi:hypothetical protein